MAFFTEIIFSKQCMPFVCEWHATCMRYPHLALNFDETVLNVLLWKHGITESVQKGILDAVSVEGAGFDKDRIGIEQKSEDLAGGIGV